MLSRKALYSTSPPRGGADSLLAPCVARPLGLGVGESSPASRHRLLSSGVSVVPLPSVSNILSRIIYYRFYYIWAMLYTMLTIKDVFLTAYMHEL